MCEPSQN